MTTCSTYFCKPPSQAAVMSTTWFSIRNHRVSVPRGNNHRRGIERTLLLAVKQYTTKTRRGNGGFTFIAAQANACPKEIYEPLWDRMHEAAATEGITICNIWMADVAYQGESGMLNKHEDYDDEMSLTDHSRHLLAMIDHFKADTNEPLIGLGHSMGGIQIAHLSLMHPNLLAGVVLIDPMIQETQSVERTLKVVKQLHPGEIDGRARRKLERVSGKTKSMEHGKKRSSINISNMVCDSHREVATEYSSTRKKLPSAPLYSRRF